MAIQLPDVKPVEPQGDASVGRIQTNVVDTRRDLAEGQAGVENIAAQAIKYRNQQADQTANTIGTNQENELALRYKAITEGDPEKGIIGTKYQKGDPDEIHRQLDARMQDTLKELSTAPDGQEWSTETQKLVNSRLTRKAQELRLQQMTEYGAQRSKYDDNITETSNKLTMQAMPASSTLIDPDSVAHGDRSTLGPVEQNLATLRQNRIEQGIRYNADKEDVNGDDHYTAADGTVKAVRLSPSTKMKILEERSEALHDTIDNLIKTGQTDPQALAKAKVLMDQYGAAIDAHKQGPLNQEYLKAETSLKAVTLSRNIQDLPPDQIQKALAAEKNPFVAKEAEKQVADHARYMNTTEKEKASQNFQVAFTQANQILAADPNTTWSMAKQDPVIQNTLSRMDSGQQKKLIAQFDPPKTSDPETTANFMHILSGDNQKYPSGLFGMKPEDLQMEMAGASKTDKNRAMSMWMSVNKMQNGQQMGSMLTHAMAELKDQSMSLGIVKADNSDGTNVVKGKENDKILTQLKDQLTDALVKRGNMSVPDMRKTVHDFLVNRQGNQTYEIPRFQGSGDAFTGGGGNKNAPPPPITRDVRTQAFADYTKDPKNKGNEPSNKQLTDYINANAAKYKVK